MVPGVNKYTLGPTGTLPSLARPLTILPNYGSAYIRDTNGDAYQVTVVDQFAWNSIMARGQEVTSDYPNVLFYDPQFPNGIINLWPIPSSSYTLYFDCKLPLSDAAALNSAISLPPGYNLMLKANLAAALMPHFGEQVSPLQEIGRAHV